MEEIKEKYLEFTACLAEKWSQYFGNAWWYGLIHEKNSIKSRAFHNLAKEIKVKEQFVPLKSLFGAVRKYLSFVMRYFLFKVKLGFRYNKPEMENIIVTYKSYLEEVGEALLSSLVVIMPQKNDWEQVIEDSRNDQRLFVLDEYIYLRDFFAVLFSSLKVMGNFLAVFCGLKKSFQRRGLQYFGKENVYESFKKELWDSFFGPVLIEGQFYERAFKNMVFCFGGAKRIIYVYEGMAWEKALCLAFEKKKKIGVVCSAPCLMNYLYREDEVKLMPKPDRVGTLGNISCEVMSEVYGKDKVFALGAVRYEHLREWMLEPKKESLGENVLLLLSANDEQSKELIDFVRVANDKSEKEWNVLVRGHPDSDLDYGPFPYSLCDLRTDLEGSQCVVATDSTAVLEAVALGVPVVIPALKSFIDTSPLLGEGEIFVTRVDIPEELREIIDKRTGVKKFSKEECKQYINDYFSFHFAQANRETV